LATFVLVHGGFHGGWCYAPVAASLRSKGHEVHTPTLSGLGDRAHLAAQAINLSTHIQDVVAVIKSYDLSDVILCGHSYGGLVITGVAGQLGERIRTLFYLDAAVPSDGDSLFGMIGPERTLNMLDAAGETGTMSVSPGAQFFAVDPENIEFVQEKCTTHPIGCFIQKLRFTGKEAMVTRRTFVCCERYPSINHATYARVKDLPGWRAISVDRGHDLMVDDPDLLSALLLQELER